MRATVLSMSRGTNEGDSEKNVSSGLHTRGRAISVAARRAHALALHLLVASSILLLQLELEQTGSQDWTDRVAKADRMEALDGTTSSTQYYY